ncbi:GrpB family protein [Paenibacillus sp. NPDC058071]|uniref:GrpB family protein n=1 Tax=Paenibacillus sp. NPDC058071 TaxID=3346326 RepID=UPI0036DC74B8
MEDQWRIAAYDPQWRVLFLDVASRLRAALGDLDIRIDHVGSTSVEGMDAKPIVDIQLSVATMELLSSYKAKIEQAGFVFREENPDKTKHYFRELPGERRTHLHVREAGSFSEQLTLLFRDYLRAHADECLRYAEEKHRLMELYKHDRPKYVEGKAPVVWDIVQKAHSWSQKTGWRPGASDR